MINYTNPKLSQRSAQICLVVECFAFCSYSSPEFEDVYSSHDVVQPGSPLSSLVDGERQSR